MASQKFIRSRVISNEPLNSKFRRLVFKLEKPYTRFVFKPGQFVIIKIPSLPRPVFRDYSIATLPEKLPFWETILDVTPNGPGCKYLCNLQAGDIIETLPPLGAFILRNFRSRKILLIATGSGIASVKPMIEELRKNNNCEIIFLWGLRFEEDIFDKDLFKENIVLSKPNSHWGGKAGHVTDYLVKADEAYLCGSQTMIGDVSKALVKLKVPRSKIYFEKYF